MLTSRHALERIKIINRKKKNTTVGGIACGEAGSRNNSKKKWGEAMFVLGFYENIFQRTGNSALLYQKFGIFFFGGGVVDNPPPRYATGHWSICLLIMLDTLLLRPSLHCNTSLHFTTLHPTTLIDTSLPLIYTSAAGTA
jgi:hypothetical protein